MYKAAFSHCQTPNDDSSPMSPRPVTPSRPDEADIVWGPWVIWSSGEDDSLSASAGVVLHTARSCFGATFLEQGRWVAPCSLQLVIISLWGSIKFLWIWIWISEWIPNQCFNCSWCCIRGADSTHLLFWYCIILSPWNLVRWTMTRKKRKWLLNL